MDEQMALVPKDTTEDAMITLWIKTKNSEHTRRNYRRHIDRFRSFLGKPLAQTTLFDLQAFVEHMRDEGVLNQNSQKVILDVIKSFLSYAHTSGLFKVNVGKAYGALKKRCLRERLTQEGPKSVDVATIVAPGVFAVLDLNPQGNHGVFRGVFWYERHLFVHWGSFRISGLIRSIVACFLAQNKPWEDTHVDASVAFASNASTVGISLHEKPRRTSGWRKWYKKTHGHQAARIWLSTRNRRFTLHLGQHIWNAPWLFLLKHLVAAGKLLRYCDGSLANRLHPNNNSVFFDIHLVSLLNPFYQLLH